MGVTGDGRDQLEVVGDGVDTVGLVQCLRKKIGHAEILKVEEVKPAEKKPDRGQALPPRAFHGGRRRGNLPAHPACGGERWRKRI